MVYDAVQRSVHFLVVILRYSRALNAADAWASFGEVPVPKQTASGTVDICNRH